MDRIKNILPNRPNFLGQTHRHRGRLVQQRIMNPRPVVQIAPQPKRLLQQVFPARTIACAAGQTSLLAADRTVEPLQMRSVDLLANAQFANTAFDIFLHSEQGLGRYTNQIAPFVALFLDNSYLQARRRFEFDMLSATAPSQATAMFDVTKDIQDCLWIRQMIVDQQQRREHIVGQRQPHRSNQLPRLVPSPRPDTQIENKPLFYRQRGVNPRAPFF